MPTEPTSIGHESTSERRAGEEPAPSQCRSPGRPRANTTRALCAESTLSATAGFGQTTSAFSGLPRSSKNSSQGSSKGNAMSANIPMTTRSNLALIRPSGKTRRKGHEDDDPGVADPDASREQRRGMRLTQDLRQEVGAPHGGHERAEPVLRPSPPRVEPTPRRTPSRSGTSARSASRGLRGRRWRASWPPRRRRRRGRRARDRAGATSGS